MDTKVRIEVLLPDWLERFRQAHPGALTLPAVPPLRDPRWVQTAILLIYSIVARVYFNLESSVTVGILCTLYACALDYLIGVFLFRKPVFPLSALIIGLSSTILVEARFGWEYFIVCTVACLSKAVLRYKGRHYFNPTCIAVTICLMLFPDYLTGIPHLFADYVWPSVVFGVLGVATVVYARQTVVSFGWLLGFVLFAFLRAWLAGAKPLFIVGPVFSTATFLFAFHMISDPGTTPRSVRWQIPFALGAAAIDAWTRYEQIPFGAFYGLAVMGTLLPWIREREEASAARVAVRASPPDPARG